MPRRTNLKAFMLILFTDTVFGNGKTPDYLLLGNMVYTVSAVLIHGGLLHPISVSLVSLCWKPSSPYKASVCPALVWSAVLSVMAKTVLKNCSTGSFSFPSNALLNKANHWRASTCSRFIIIFFISWRCSFCKSELGSKKSCLCVAVRGDHCVSEGRVGDLLLDHGKSFSVLCSFVLTHSSPMLLLSLSSLMLIIKLVMSWENLLDP